MPYGLRMKTAELIIERFGGTRALARVLGKPPTTVQSWKDAGHIPAKHQGDVLAAATANGIPLTPADFFPPAPEPAQ